MTDTPYLFDLDGGRLCLDFTNTRGFSSEHLFTYADLLAFASQAHLLTPHRADQLQAQAVKTPRAAQATFERATRLREALRGIFMAVAQQQPPPQSDLDLLNADLATSLPHARLVLDETTGACSWAWASADDLSAPLWPIVRSAADLLTSEDEPALVRECGASDCAWLFVDTSKNRSRQWCSMQSCGNREKARRHYQRIRDQRSHVETAVASPVQRRARRKPAMPLGGASAMVD